MEHVPKAVLKKVKYQKLTFENDPKYRDIRVKVLNNYVIEKRKVLPGYYSGEYLTDFF